MSEKNQTPPSILLSPNGTISYGGTENNLHKNWICIYLEWLESKGIDTLAVPKIETVINGELAIIKTSKKEGVYAYDLISIEHYPAHGYDREINLDKGFSLIGFDSKQDMDAWIQKFNSMDGEHAPPPFKQCSAYKGRVLRCEPKEEWFERKGEMQGGGYWYKSYDGAKYCKNNFNGSFESALNMIGKPSYVIVIDKSKF